MALSPQWLDELRARTTLSSVVMRTTKLQRAGREWKACCPFHEEKSPSFTVNDEKGFYHCFGCGAHGDVIRWMTDQRGLPFMDAVKELAVQAGLEIPAPDPRAARQAEKRATLVDVTQAAQEWFVAALHSDAGEQARTYLAKRGFSDATVREFGFGYAPDSKQALPRALPEFDEELLSEAGMRIAVEGKPPYDRFRDRLMLPIHDQRGRVIGFGGRILESQTKNSAGAPKYLNSPDTPLFDKGRTLYNLHRAAPITRKSGRMIVVEGYMDAIALADAGIGEVVAPLGTALTEQQIELLWRHAERPILCFDGDAAGQRAAMRAVERALPMLRPGCSLQIVRLPAGLDPDDVLRERGVGALENLLAESTGLLETLWRFERDAQVLDSPESKAGLKARLLAHVDTIQDRDIRSLYRRDLLQRFSDFAFPPREKRDWQAQRPRLPVLAPEAAARLRQAMNGGSRDAFAGAVIAGLMRFPDQISRHEESLLRFARRDRNVGKAIESLLQVAETLDLQTESPISPGQGQPAPPVKTPYAFLDEGTAPDEAREDLAEAVSLLVERPALEAALAEATARFGRNPEGSIAEQARLRTRLQALNERLKHFGRRKAAAAVETQIAGTAGTPQPERAETD